MAFQLMSIGNYLICVTVLDEREDQHGLEISTLALVVSPIWTIMGRTDPMAADTNEAHFQISSETNL